LATFGAILVLFGFLLVPVGSFLTPFRLNFDHFGGALSIFMIVHPFLSICFEIIKENQLKNQFLSMLYPSRHRVISPPHFCCVRFRRTPAHDRQHLPQLMFLISISLHRFYTNFVRGAPHIG
jgi:hypothetical protein